MIPKNPLTDLHLSGEFVSGPRWDNSSQVVLVIVKCHKNTAGENKRCGEPDPFISSYKKTCYCETNRYNYPELTHQNKQGRHNEDHHKWKNTFGSEKLLCEENTQDEKCIKVHIRHVCICETEKNRIE